MDRLRFLSWKPSASRANSETITVKHSAAGLHGSQRILPYTRSLSGWWLEPVLCLRVHENVVMWHWLFHDWEYTGTSWVVFPKRGPYDPTPDSERNTKLYTCVCCQCGVTKTEKAPDDCFW